MSGAGSFSAVIAERLTTQYWTNLLDGGIGILRLPHFISPQRCAAALDELNDDRFVIYDLIEEFGGSDPLSHSQIRSDYLAGSRPGGPPVSRRLGGTLYEHAARGTVKEYFDRARAWPLLCRRHQRGARTLTSSLRRRT